MGKMKSSEFDRRTNKVTFSAHQDIGRSVVVGVSKDGTETSMVPVRNHNLPNMIQRSWGWPRNKEYWAER